MYIPSGSGIYLYPSLTEGWGRGRMRREREREGGR